MIENNSKLDYRYNVTTCIITQTEEMKIELFINKSYSTISLMSI